MASFQVYFIDLMATFLDCLRNGKSSIAFSEYVILEGVVITHKFLGDSVGFGPYIVYFFHDDEV